MLTINEIRQNEEINNYIEQANKALEALGFTDHGFGHVERCVRTLHEILEKLNYDEDTIRLGEIAAYMHDIGNVVNRISCTKWSDYGFSYFR